ncbi:Phytanoyl-CoA dioxygenase (PhyH) [Roseomonas rosea]|uniref:Phytanoyl-CoA dioxygenase (PhyH) n=1 Tax=Muricoccus roseus TaxID=198092 RepID=A0A1M6ASD8_9PROT|nr:phytanoyl-CoA dioxygenase family protein [Roseomonas rosea]SHI39382.1 Phytanoyl-CoA dioxygenase (PhyH) [Roseomonas rosea]
MTDHAKPGLEEFDWLMRTKGWVLFRNVVPAAQLGPIREAVLRSIEDCGQRQVALGATAAPDGTSHHALGQYPALDEFLAGRWLAEEVGHYFGGAPFILHAFNPVCVDPGATSYVHAIHRDVRTHGGDFRLMLNMLVMVDPFTLENGATYVLSGSQRCPQPPPEALFRDGAERLTGPAGSIVLFDSNLWHAAGENRSGTPRAALTLSFSRAFIKQQMDYPRFLGPDYGRRLSPEMRQLLGYNAMVPTSYEEFYRPRALRLYKGDQG